MALAKGKASAPAAASDEKGLVRLTEIPPYMMFSPEGQEAAEAFAENLGGDNVSAFDLDQIKVPAGDGPSLWTVPNITGASDYLDILTGIIVYQRTPRGYWSKDLQEGGGGSPPDCSSDDGIIGVGNPGGPCKLCPFAQYGSAHNGRAQACKARRALFLMREDSAVPLCVLAPPSSLGALKKYLIRLSGQGIPYYGCVTSLMLSKAKNVDGITYHEIIPNVVSVLPPEARAMARDVKDRLEPMLRSARLDLSDEQSAGIIDPAYAGRTRPLTADDLDPDIEP